jgi:hypothetical protein
MRGTGHKPRFIILSPNTLSKASSKLCNWEGDPESTEFIYEIEERAMSPIQRVMDLSPWKI